MPVHVYDAATGHCVLTILRPGKTPDGKEVRAHLRRLVRRIRRHWPRTRITIRGDSHYGRRERLIPLTQARLYVVFGLAVYIGGPCAVSNKISREVWRLQRSPESVFRRIENLNVSLPSLFCSLVRHAQPNHRRTTCGATLS
jgi:hypothetical protein